MEDEEEDTVEDKLNASPHAAEELTVNETKNPNVSNKKCNKKTCTKKIWTEEEIGTVLKFFAPFIKRTTIPGKAKCEECMEKYPIFGTRKWTDLKFYIKNYINKIKKNK